MLGAALLLESAKLAQPPGVLASLNVTPCPVWEDCTPPINAPWGVSSVRRGDVWGAGGGARRHPGGASAADLVRRHRPAGRIGYGGSMGDFFFWFSRPWSSSRVTGLGADREKVVAGGGLRREQPTLGRTGLVAPGYLESRHLAHHLGCWAA